MSTQVLSLAAKMNGLHLCEQEKVPLVATLLAPFRNGQIKNLGSLKQLFQAVLFSYKTMQLTIESIEQGKLIDFDPLVSDCACQSRALFVALFVKKLLSKPVMQGEIRSLKTKLTLGIEAVQRKITVITPKNELKPAPKKNLLFFDAITLEEADLQVPSKLVTLATAFLLTKTKGSGTRMSACGDCSEVVAGFQESTDYEAANILIHRLDPPPQVASKEESKNEGGKAKAKAKDSNKMKAIVDAAKVALAKTSCELILEASRGLELDPLAQLMLGKTQKVHGRDELPCYATCQVVFKKAMKENISVLLKVRRAPHLVESLRDPYDVALLLKPVQLTSGNKRFVACHPAKEDMHSPLIVVETQRCGAVVQNETTDEYVQRLCNENFMDLIELNAGAHKQYSADGVQISLVEEIAKKMPSAAEFLLESLADFAARAKLKGCTHDSQKLMAITHIFCDTLKNQLIDLGVGT